MTRDERTRQLLKRATAAVEPRVDRLIARVPAMLAEAERRRQRTTTVTLLDALVDAAASWMPRMALASGALAVAAAALLITEWQSGGSVALDLLGLDVISVGSER